MSRIPKDEIPAGGDLPEADAFFEKLSEHDREVEIAESQRDAAQQNVDTHLNDRGVFLQQTNIERFVTEKLREEFDYKKRGQFDFNDTNYEKMEKAIIADAEAGLRSNRKISEVIKEMQQGINFTIQRNKNNRLTQEGAFLITSTLNYIDNSKRITRTEHRVWEQNHTTNAIIIEGLKKLGIKPEHIHITLHQCKFKTGEKPSTQITVDLTTDVIRDIIAKQVEKRLEQKENIIHETEKKLKEAGQYMHEYTGSQEEVPDQPISQLDKMRQQARTLARAEVTREILGKAIGNKGRDDDLPRHR